MSVGFVLGGLVVLIPKDKAIAALNGDYTCDIFYSRVRYNTSFISNVVMIAKPLYCTCGSYWHILIFRT